MRSVGRHALEAGLCTAVACFEYDSPAIAKRAWERAAERTKREDARGVSINRIMDPARPAVQFVIAAGEDADRVALVAAVLASVAELRGGVVRRVNPPDLVLEATAAKRAQLLARAKDTRIVVRHGGGTIIDTDGQERGPVRRPQG